VLETEVLETAMPQYIQAAREMTALERANFGVWRGSLLLVLPVLKIVEAMLALALAGLGFIYPELKRFTHERRHFRLLNRLVADATAYQNNAKLHYMTTSEIRESFAIESGSDATVEKQTE
jgi:hypothetical protein